VIEEECLIFRNQNSVTGSQHHSSLHVAVWKQESRAIAKVTARCAVHVHGLDSFESPWLRHAWLLLQKLLMGFCCNGLYENAYKIRSSELLPFLR